MMKCYKCGSRIETIPVHCGHSMILNEETNQWECFMGSECGFIKIDEMLCSKCADAECNP
jgi:hypothetical protein